jgi:ubiquinone/menaquinone biosynthesis C-methylase UbiE/uncharacterized protein YbaR (Trm112 family)
MKTDIIKILKCPLCGGRPFKLEAVAGLYDEYRDGALLCGTCNYSFPLDEGIADFLAKPSPEILEEQKASSREARVKTEEGDEFLINPKTIEKFSKLFLSLPKGDGSYFFKEGGSFQNFAEGSHRFFDLFDSWNIKPGMKVLELGAGFCWASREFAKRGCDVVAVDITDYLKVADLYLKNGLYFERFYADMDKLPFEKDSFDLIFAAATIHHSSDLDKTFKELNRVLKKNGKIILLNECFIGIFEKPQQHTADFGYNDHYYPVWQWQKVVKESGFSKVKVTFLSFLKDYIARKESRGLKTGLKLKLAKAIIRVPVIDKLLSILLIPHRIFFRPRSILIEATK